MDKIVKIPTIIGGGAETTITVNLTPEEEEFVYSMGLIEIEIRKATKPQKIKALIVSPAGESELIGYEKD